MSDGSKLDEQMVRIRKRDGQWQRLGEDGQWRELPVLRMHPRDRRTAEGAARALRLS